MTDSGLQLYRTAPYRVDAVTQGGVLDQLEDTDDPFEGYPSIEDRNINNPLANIISTEEYETEVYQIESSLRSRIVAEIPDIQSIMDSIDAIKDDWMVREKALPKDLKMLSEEGLGQLQRKVKIWQVMLSMTKISVQLQSRTNSKKQQKELIKKEN